MARRSALRRQEFSFPPGSPARGEEGDQGERRTPLPPRPRPAAANSISPRAGEEDFRWLQASRLGSPESAGSGTPSPQLWAHGHGHHHRLYPASAGSSPSRAQAIAGYRREMLDLVSGLPEAAYELSLRDIVESRPSPLPLPPPPPPPPLQPPHTATVQEQGQDVPKKDVAAATAVGEEAKEPSGGAKKQVKAGKARKQRTMGRTRSRSMERSVSLDTGLLIKLFLPLSVGRKKVSPKPASSAAAKNGEKKKKKHGKEEEEEEDEWWKKSESSEAGSSSRTSSTSSTNSTASRNGNGGSNPKPPARSRSRKRIGCYAFFRADKSKNGAIQE